MVSVLVGVMTGSVEAMLVKAEESWRLDASVGGVVVSAETTSVMFKNWTRGFAAGSSPAYLNGTLGHFLDECRPVVASKFRVQKPLPEVIPLTEFHQT